MREILLVSFYLLASITFSPQEEITMVQERWRHGGKVGQILVKESRKMGVTYHLATPAAVHAESKGR